ncbi:MAG: ATP-binding cassette domain-containing protein [Holophagaceae bacterium]|nr:ATP-binding cassette domain-containing protein [Holophagaceae bacterium]
MTIPAIFKLKNMTASQGGIQVLNVPSLDIESGKVTAVVGPNGSGKTTLLLCLAGLMEITRGSLLFNGVNISGTSKQATLRQHTTLVFHEPLLFNTTVQGNIEAGLQLRGLPKSERLQRISNTARLLGISHLLNRSAIKLSGGESQRTSIARAIAMQPDVLLLDEPFSALDAPSKTMLLNDLGHILAKTNTTAIFSTHDLTDAIYLADYIAVLNGGTLVQWGPTQEILQNPKDTFVSALVESAKTTAELVLKNTRFREDG